MIDPLFRLAAIVLVSSLALPFGAAAEGTPWDQAQMTQLAAQLHEGVKGLRSEIQGTPKDLGTGQASAYYRLVDNLELIERESRHLHTSLESGAGRESTLHSYARIAMLRRNCAEEMERLYVSGPALERISRARAIVKQMDPQYGFDPSREDHDRVLEP